MCIIYIWCILLYSMVFCLLPFRLRGSNLIIETVFLLITLAIVFTLCLFISEFNQNVSSSVNQASGKKYKDRKTLII